MLNILLVTPPFTQLNTPYPATAYLKGFLDSLDLDIKSHQVDLSIELFNEVFTSEFIQSVFDEAAEELEGQQDFEYSEVWHQRDQYIRQVDQVIRYLKQPETTAAYQILSVGYLPQAHRSQRTTAEFQHAFGTLGILDKAKYLATQFIDEIGDFIRVHVDQFFAFTRYAEQIAKSASSFDQIDAYLQYEPTLIEEELLSLLDEKIDQIKPDLVCFTIPFPGNLFSALRSAQYIKGCFSSIKVAFGGGYCNTELLSLSDPTIFDYVDYITTGDGEGPIYKLIKHLMGQVGQDELERTFVEDKGQVKLIDHQPSTPFHHKDIPAASYAGLPLDHYISFLDVMNPMHRLWSDGRWNKLTLAHGCYWKQCSFCDVSLDYIKIYQNTTAEDLVNKIEKMVAETGTTGFHFVDEAAPPQALKKLARLLIEREVHITWWGNIRFEKTFDLEFCQLLARSGCIAVTGGLETASDRLLDKMKKGVDIAQVARVTKAFSESGIMVHAYLMFGFPTQTEQETIDSLEIVRQLFEYGCIQSAFWHQFSTTAHSPVGKNPEAFGIKITGPEFQGFALNDLFHEDPEGADHAQFSQGLNRALQSYLNGLDFEKPLNEWFDFEVPGTTHPRDAIAQVFEIQE